MATLKKFGDLIPGDVLVGTSSKTVVTKAYEEHIPESMYRLEFDEGSVIEASGNHLWYIETALDRALHKKRVKSFRKLFKCLPGIVEDELLEVINLEESAETALIDMVSMLECEGDRERVQAIVRIAESLGPVAEENVMLEDYLTGEEVSYNEIRLYDAKLFAQQILALYSKGYEKKWPIIVGQVVTTEYLARLAMDVEIPEVKSL